MVDLCDVYSPSGVVFTTLDELRLHRRCETIVQLQSHIQQVLRTAKVIEDTIEEMRTIKGHLLQLSEDVSFVADCFLLYANPHMY